MNYYTQNGIIYSTSGEIPEGADKLTEKGYAKAIEKQEAESRKVEEKALEPTKEQLEAQEKAAKEKEAQDKLIVELVEDMSISNDDAKKAFLSRLGVA